MDEALLKKTVLKYKEEILYPYDSIIDLIGFEALCKIAETFSGSQIYVPTKKNLFGRCIEQQILSEFNGTNYKQLAKKYELCENTIRKFVDYSKSCRKSKVNRSK